MKKILVVVVLVLAAASFVSGQTGRGAASKQGVNAGQMMLQVERGWSRGLSGTKLFVNMFECSTLTFLTESLPNFPPGEHSSFQIEAIGGTPPYSFQITGGVLPAGLKFKKDGTIKGTPTQEDDTTIFVLLTDSAGCTLTQAFAVRATPD